MDLRKLDAGEILAGVAGIVLIAAMALMDWFGVDVPPGTEPVGGFDAFRAFDVVDILLLLVGLAAIALPVSALVRPKTDKPKLKDPAATASLYLTVTERPAK